MQPPNEATTEERARAVRYWEEQVRPQMVAKEKAKVPEDPHSALARLKSEGWGDVHVSDAIRATLPTIKRPAP
ncbi:hypothetical protein [Microvirga sp. BSC39]|uniref:hypothetical protein n=1 Tax=Microvirga sp. BSC39 TaxID=1549810 RepID=UPI0004E94D91|nr:hypothetical protein [Microvirga sp. BSC39]KFG68687.1 hypothetical protein JH26_14520 [Microvirga sp. BSC39]